MVFSFFLVFCNLLPNQIINSTFVIMSELKFFLLTRDLAQNFNTMKFIKFLKKKSKTSHLDRSSHIEGNIMKRTISKKGKK
jgi:hypothetical protein